ncbi:MAG: GNAT family N-acetyltransferase [Acidimicrobiia bacterium]
MSVDVAPLKPEERDTAVGVLARGMRDNPLHVAAFGDDPERRVAQLAGMFQMVLTTQPDALRADEAGTIVGTCGLGSGEPCAFAGFAETPRDQFPPMSDDPAAVDRLYEWLTTWAARDPEERHLHLGPIAADAGRQGQGIGTAMMKAFCARADRDGELAYLETDKSENVGFYEKFGFETVGEAPVIGVTNWFMRRAPR